MRRFYAEARAVPADGGHAVELDGRPLRTPARQALVVPTCALAQAIAAEWNRQGEAVDPRALPLTGLAYAAIDRIASDREATARSLARYAASDLVCYRAEGPPPLVERQAALWGPVLDWARRRYGIDLTVVCGILPAAQPDAALERLEAAVLERSAFELAALSPLVTASGSLLVALAVAEGALDPEKAWAAAALDEQWQAERWGEDPEAAKSLAARRRDFEAGCRLLALLRA